MKAACPEIPEEETTDFSREDPENLVWEGTFADQSCQRSRNETRASKKKKKCIKMYNPRFPKVQGCQQGPSIEKREK